MCKLVSMQLYNGGEVLVAEHKKEHILRYIDVFKKYKEISRVILYGSALEERCTEKSDTDLWIVYNCNFDAYCNLLDNIWDEYPEGLNDDLLGCSVEEFSRVNCGALRDVKKKGVCIYESQCGYL